MISPTVLNSIYRLLAPRFLSESNLSLGLQMHISSCPLLHMDVRILDVWLQICSPGVLFISVYGTINNHSIAWPQNLGVVWPPVLVSLGLVLILTLKTLFQETPQSQANQDGWSSHPGVTQDLLHYLTFYVQLVGSASRHTLFPPPPSPGPSLHHVPPRPSQYPVHLVSFLPHLAHSFFIQEPEDLHKEKTWL